MKFTEVGKNEKTNRQDTIYKVSSTLCILGTVNYYDIPGIFTI